MQGHATYAYSSTNDEEVYSLALDTEDGDEPAAGQLAGGGAATTAPVDPDGTGTLSGGKAKAKGIKRSERRGSRLSGFDDTEAEA